MTTLRALAAVFPVEDVGSTIRWYEANLGFGSVTHPPHEPYEWASMGRDGVEIMLQRVREYSKPDLYSMREGGVWDVYIRIEGIQDFFESVRENVDVISPLTRLDYGCIEFEVLDPNGYVLVFGECA